MDNALIFAHWSPSKNLEDCYLTLFKSLSRFNYTIFIVTNSEINSVELAEIPKVDVLKESSFIKFLSQ